MIMMSVMFDVLFHMHICAKTLGMHQIVVFLYPDYISVLEVGERFPSVYLLNTLWLWSPILVVIYREDAMLRVMPHKLPMGKFV